MHLIFLRLFPIPTKGRNPTGRNIWIKLINRQKIGKRQYWEPSKDSRVCSDHFVDGLPSEDNPYPTQKMGYEDAEKRAIMFSPVTGKRKSRLPQKLQDYETPTQKNERKKGVCFPSLTDNDITQGIEENIDKIKDTELDKVQKI